LRVFTNGVFDLIHYGHVNFLNQARKLGDELIVLINSDSSATRIKRKPFHNWKERSDVLESLKAVNAVYVFDEDTPSKVLEDLTHDGQPFIYVKSSEYINKFIDEEAIINKCNGQLVFIKQINKKKFSSRNICK